MSRKLSRNSRRAIVASLLGLTVGGGVLASAASLGVTGGTLGAGTVIIASCDLDGVALKYTHAYVVGVPVVGSYRTTGVTISGIDPACATKALNVTLKDAAGAPLASASLASISGTSTGLLPLSGSGADAAAVVGAAVVISD